MADFAFGKHNAIAGHIYAKNVSVHNLFYSIIISSFKITYLISYRELLVIIANHSKNIKIMYNMFKNSLLFLKLF